MRRASPLLLPALLALAGCIATSQGRYNIEERETIRRALEFPSGQGTKILEVDNVSGSIRLTGYDGSGVEVVANKTIRAESKEKIQTAKEEVTLDISQKAETINISADWPRWDRSNSSTSRARWKDPGYEVTFDFEIRVPRQTEIRLSTVNRGEIRVENVIGDFDVNNINGGIDMRGVAGSGRAHTINGPVTVNFARNPQRNSHFGSLNGDIEVTFQGNLSADLRFKSFNGGVYTDFPVKALPTPVNTPERRDGKFVYRNTFSGARIGDGGPMLEFDGFNGDVRILQAK
jgi:hypothetical protein